MEDTDIQRFSDEYSRNKLKLLRDKIVQKLLLKQEWNMVFEELPVLTKKKKTRKQAKDIRTIDHIKEVLLKRLGYVPVYMFLNLMASICGTPEGPYRKSELYLIILYMLVKNKSADELDSLEIIPSTSIRRVADQIWDDNRDELNVKVDQLLAKMFSSHILRSVTAKLENDKDFLFATMFLDGHDTRIEYNNLATYSRFDYWSFKFKNSGLRTQVLMDVNEFTLAVSKSEACKANTDMKMFTIMDIHNNVDMTNHDVVFLDGGYFLGMNDYVESLQEKGVEFGLDNFRTPIRKSRNIPFDDSEAAYNEKFGAFRGTIETLFSFLAEKFEYFSNKNHASCVAEMEQKWNLQFKVCLLLVNVLKFCKKFNVETQTKHRLWINKEFDFEFNTDKKLIPTPVLQEQLQYSRDSLKKQQDYLDRVLEMTEEELEEELERTFSLSDFPQFNPSQDITISKPKSNPQSEIPPRSQVRSETSQRSQSRLETPPRSQSNPQSEIPSSPQSRTEIPPTSQSRSETPSTSRSSPQSETPPRSQSRSETSQRSQSRLEIPPTSQSNPQSEIPPKSQSRSKTPPKSQSKSKTSPRSQSSPQSRSETPPKSQSNPQSEIPPKSQSKSKTPPRSQSRSETSPISQSSPQSETPPRSQSRLEIPLSPQSKSKRNHPTKRKGYYSPNDEDAKRVTLSKEYQKGVSGNKRSRKPPPTFDA
ncbi:predicted protein [Naegleria gruberi]|uniref:Predicted protein n=1 Tax=Naegleria gruberi TaxID=5762 RepID=D2VAM9_NAEGR|nr:uncharacterized protein NAEGRDRAFT_79233 [Naegleria gruberi]EFC45982.1 predicted protein [Naegleria gruberi]|eukprot:XP_002678726.1 predicted protein [Naegleria gruberi strain NEG-M]